MKQLSGAEIIRAAKHEAKQQIKENKKMKPKFTDKQISIKTLFVTITALVLGGLAGYFINDVISAYAESKAQSLVTSINAGVKTEEVSKP